MKIKLEIEGVEPKEVERYHEILTALIKTGALTGVRGGQTIIHFDGEGHFMGVELDYWPWRRRKIDRQT